ncbi:hypothetical protein NPIL_205221 [Nephila pilipes]|uniref:Uncharacterized protein n=1 Tax=Nephila pilipes TaxID=299642 RepID=A0A8X6M5H6_NEPPI|nr:hypothetical protein NPIL_205221 [Nephila pilipes]
MRRRVSSHMDRESSPRTSNGASPLRGGREGALPLHGRRVESKKEAAPLGHWSRVRERWKGEENFEEDTNSGEMFLPLISFYGEMI